MPPRRKEIPQMPYGSWKPRTGATVRESPRATSPNSSLRPAMAPICAIIMCITKGWAAILPWDAKRIFASPSSAGKIRKTPRPAPWRPRPERRVRTARRIIFAFCIVSAKARASVARRSRGRKEAVALPVAPRSLHRQSHQILNPDHHNGNGGERKVERCSQRRARRAPRATAFVYSESEPPPLTKPARRRWRCIFSIPDSREQNSSAWTRASLVLQEPPGPAPVNPQTRSYRVDESGER